MRNRLHGLYAITDASLMPANIFNTKAEQALQGGAKIIKYRDKSQDLSKRLQQAKFLKKICLQHKALLIINDDIQLAIETNADGVHIGINDISLAEARTKLGLKKIIGISCYNQFELAQQAEKEGADYIAFGSFFSSPTKPDAKPASIDLLEKAKNQLSIPVCAIGGININNAGILLDAGADMLAVISGVIGEQDVTAASLKFKNLFEQHN